MEGNHSQCAEYPPAMAAQDEAVGLAFASAELLEAPPAPSLKPSMFPKQQPFPRVDLCPAVWCHLQSC